MVRRIFSAATTTLRLLLRVVVAAGAITTLTMAAQTVKYAATQAELIAALGSDTTVVLNNTILLESSTDVTNSNGYDEGATGIVIENVKGLVIDGAGFAIDGQGKMRCLYVGPNSDVALIDTTVKNGFTDSYVSNKASESKNSSKSLLPAFLVLGFWYYPLTTAMRRITPRLLTPPGLPPASFLFS